MCGPFLNTILGDFPVNPYQADNADMAYDTEQAFAPRAHVVDRVTFNYGRALGRPRENDPAGLVLVPAWENNSVPAEYDHYEKQARAFAAISTQFTHAAWAIDMALRDVRCSETLEEQGAAMLEARRIFHKVDRELEAPSAAGVKYQRYGRIGNVLKRFFPFGR